MPANRLKTGRKRFPNATSWKPGQTGNPKGRPSDADVTTVRQLARYTPDGQDDTIKTFEALRRVRDKSKSPHAVVLACRELLDRAWGKAKEYHEVTGKDGGPLQYANAREEIMAYIASVVRRNNSE